MGRIKCVKLECSICHKVGLAQIFLRKDGSISYARVRHYSHLDKVSKKPQFTYCKIEDLETLKALIKSKGISLSIDEVKKGQLGQGQTNKNHDLKLKDSSLNQQNQGRSSSSWLGHKPSKLAIPGSNPGDRTIILGMKLSLSLLNSQNT
jgi:hypothetical protein